MHCLCPAYALHPTLSFARLQAICTVPYAAMFEGFPCALSCLQMKFHRLSCIAGVVASVTGSLAWGFRFTMSMSVVSLICMLAVHYLTSRGKGTAGVQVPRYVKPPKQLLAERIVRSRAPARCIVQLAQSLAQCITQTTTSLHQYIMQAARESSISYRQHSFAY